jgi:hypothetical protein
VWGKDMMINHILLFIVGLLGFPIGLIIAKFSKEELKVGIKYFKIVEHVLFLIAIFFALIDSIITMIVLIVVISFVLFKKLKYWHYPVLLLIYILSIFFGMPVIVASVIFLYGLVRGSVVYYQKPSFLKRFKYL